MEKTNINSKTNGFTNSEMYQMSRNGAIESVGFWTSDLDYIKEKTTFAKTQNCTIACLCDWYDNGATYYEKVDGKWFELDEERAESIKAELREKGRKMVEAAKKEMETNNTIKKNSELISNAKNEVCEETQEERAAALEWLVERFIEDDNYARQLIDDVDSGKATLDELLLVVKCGLIARYERVTGKSLIDGDPYMAILTLDLLNTRCEQLYDGVGLCDVQPLIDEFGAKRWPVYVGIANAKKNEMGLDW